ncbi:hypothetical protein ACIP9G_06480 [Lysinibacillus sp. NPDC093197]|uniref:hypothetical protein n=1 Tax=Lysinibacillus sp. NPDC093197 TaxID=3364132 RepID=UPI0038118134
MEIKVMAEVYRLGITIGYFTIKDVIDWADAIIEKLEHPPVELIDISLSSKAKPNDICSLLHSFYGSPYNDSPLQILLGMLSCEYTYSKNLGEVASMLFRLIDYIQLEERAEWILKEILHLSDAYFLAEQKIYGDLQAVENDIKKFLQLFLV